MFDERFLRRLLALTQPNDTFATMLPRERFGQQHFPYSHFLHRRFMHQRFPYRRFPRQISSYQQFLKTSPTSRRSGRTYTAPVQIATTYTARARLASTHPHPHPHPHPPTHTHTHWHRTHTTRTHRLFGIRYPVGRKTVGGKPLSVHF